MLILKSQLRQQGQRKILVYVNPLAVVKNFILSFGKMNLKIRAVYAHTNASVLSLKIKSIRMKQT